MIYNWNQTDNTFELWTYDCLDLNWKHEYLKALTEKTYNDDIAFLIASARFMVRYKDANDLLLV